MKAIIINEIGQKQDGILSNAIDDYSVRNVKEDEVILHLFQHPGINMGTDDFFHDDLENGIRYFEKKGMPVFLRQSGGRAIVSDEGVLNMSLIYQSSESYEDSYRYYAKFIQDALSPISKSIEVGMIDGAYCPGTYDLSISGKKFCGTAQKRVGKGIELDSYLSVNGDQTQRTLLISGFYQALGINPFPIHPDFMASLEEFTASLEINDVVEMFINEMRRRYDTVKFISIADLNQEKLSKSIQWTEKRHQKIL